MHRLWSAGMRALVALTTVTALAQPAVSAAQGTAVRPAPLRAAVPHVLPGTRATAFTTIQGNALNSTNGALAGGSVRLRDARYGRIVDAQVTDKSGLFAFNTVDPGTYVVELVGNDQAVLAASQLLTVGAGETVSAIVKLPFRLPPLAGVLGHTVQQAVAITSAAAASGVLATEVTGVSSSAR
jgi:hypothetical protein